MPTFEAEDTTRLSLENYIVFDSDIASGGQAIEIPKTNTTEQGFIRLTWTEDDGPAGNYNFKIAYFDELDGRSTLTLRVNDIPISRYIFNKNPGEQDNPPIDTPNSGNYIGLTGSIFDGLSNPNPVFKDVELAPGDQIEISAVADSLGNQTYELARIDVIEITPALEAGPVITFPELTITPTDGTLAETVPKSGGITITRTGDISQSLEVTYTVSGTASPSDYKPILTGTVTIPEGQESVDLKLTPIADGIAEGEETVIITLENSPDYQLGETPSATFTITDNDQSTITESVTIFWRNDETGVNGAWLMDGLDLAQAVTIHSPTEPADSPWQMQGAGDFNSDQQQDLLWRNSSTGETGIWLMAGSVFQNAVSITPTLGLDWEIRGTEDFNSDQQQDILWRNTSTGENKVWLMNGTNVAQEVSIPSEPVTSIWEMRAAGDLDGDGDGDIIWRNTQDQTIYYWRMEGTQYIESVLIDSPISIGQEVIHGTLDIDDNGFDDILWRNLDDGQNSVWLMNANGFDRLERLEPVTDPSWQSYV
ncbi:MAG: hypothetical protein F6J94_31825 [Moorea sp. SIO1F2]|uniref:FG-GAP-like repeat-containing protein n=1 Tax=Moorena sp. SIO1F2 TaxID=2607819 RepID=UPI0013BAD023|nr:FG-GAP-like repeat-containing protein [Moorena sp. SIO1F2]NET86291.1 hypothetical protein [Moorena sp. SIO1F2]